MKKIIIPIALILLTGCLGEAGKGYITKTCKKTETINGKNIDTEIKIKSKTGTLEQITIKETYDKEIEISSILDSKKSEQNLFKQTTGIELEINNNIYTYKINTQEITELIKDRFNIKKEQHEQIKYYEENGYTCK